jgi:hypothetical protein
LQSGGSGQDRAEQNRQDNNSQQDERYTRPENSDELETNEEVRFRENVLAELTGYSTFRALTQKMHAMQQQGLIRYGNRDDFHNLEGALVIVSDPNRVHDYLFFRNNRYMKVDSGEEVFDLSEKYSGKYQIWIQVN